MAWILECQNADFSVQESGWFVDRDKVDHSLYRASRICDTREMTGDEARYRWRNIATGVIEYWGGVEFADPNEQPEPHGKGREIAPLVIADLLGRVEKGVSTYGEPLRADNGRDVLRDLYEELLDAAMYIRQLMEERK